MSKGLEALKQYRNQQVGVNVYADELLDIVEKELKEHEQYKDIEKELGIDLLTLIKALKKGVFYKDYKEPIRHTNNLRLSCLTHNEHWSLDNKWHWFALKEYGKTWALTKEELK